MTRPNIYLIRMLLFLAAVAGVAALLSQKLLIAFANNPPLNGLIAAVLLAGIAWNLRQVLRLSPEVSWIEAFRIAPDRAGTAAPPTLLAPMASMLVARADAHEGRRITLSAAITRGMLDSLASRLDESRELSRYTTGLLIFLGLLGTFWGLLLTVGSVSDVPSLCTAWEPPSPVQCSAFPAPWCSASSISPLARRRTAFSTSWRSGWPA